MNVLHNNLHTGNSPARWRRPLVVLALSVLLHWFFLNWAGGRLGQSAAHVTDPASETVITASLQAAPTRPTASAASPQPTPPAATPKPARRATRLAERKVAAPIADLPPPTEQSRATADAQPTSPPSENLFVPDIGDNPRQPIAGGPPAMVPPISNATGTDTAAEATAATSTAKQYKTAPLPSAEVRYDVRAQRDGKTVYGSGKIAWQTSGDTYTIDGEAGVLFFSVLTFKSEGSVAADGIMPLRYNEKRFRKPSTNTHFQRDNHLISFSASTATYPRSGGEQDRASIVWQLAAIGRGDSAQFTSGAALDIFVAGVRDGEVWSIKVIAQEDIEIAGGSLPTWHLQRLPRPGSYDTQVDIWLAPTRGWYPVRLRQTERNGDVLDMTMSSISPT